MSTDFIAVGLLMLGVRSSVIAFRGSKYSGNGSEQIYKIQVQKRQDI